MYMRAHRCGQLTGPQLLWLTRQVAKAGKQEIGQGMLHILVTTFTDLLQTLPRNPPPSFLKAPPADPNAPPQQQQKPGANASPRLVPAANGESTKMERAQHRPQVSAQQMQAESQQLLRQQRALEVESRHESMRQARRKLPAFGRREDLLAQLKQQSVIIISGATGGAQIQFCPLSCHINRSISDNTSNSHRCKQQQCGNGNDYQATRPHDLHTNPRPCVSLATITKPQSSNDCLALALPCHLYW